MEQNSWTNFLDVHHTELVSSLQLTDEFLEALLGNNIITRNEYDVLDGTPPFFTRNMKYIELLRYDARRIDFPKIINFFARYGDVGNKKAATLFQKFWEASKSGSFSELDSEIAKPILHASDELDFRLPPDKASCSSADSADPATSAPLDNGSECKIHRENSLDTKVLYILALFSPYNVPRSWLDVFMKDEVCDGSSKKCLGAAMSRLEKSGPVRSDDMRRWIDDSKGAIKNTLEELKSRCRQNDSFLRSFLYLVAEQLSLSKRDEMERALYCLLANLTDLASCGPASKFLLHIHGTGLWSDVTVDFLETFRDEVCRGPAGHEHVIRKFQQYVELQKRNQHSTLNLHFLRSDAAAPSSGIQSSTSASCSWYNFPSMPSAPPILWTMRSPELELFMKPSDSTHIRIAVITGMAGSGKSTLAQLFTSDYTFRRNCRNVVWIKGSSTSSITKAFQELSVELCLSPVMDSEDPETTVFKLVENVYNQLLFSETLLVFDDAEAFEGPNGIQPFLPGLLLRNTYSPLVIITSRNMNEWDKLPKHVYVRLRPLTTEQIKFYVARRLSPSSDPSKTLERLKYAESFSWNFTALECAMETIEDPEFAPLEDDWIPIVGVSNHWKHRSQIRSLPAFKPLRMKLQDLFDRLEKLSHGSMAAEVLRFGAIVGCKVSVAFIWEAISEDTGNIQLRRAFRGALNLLLSQSLAEVREEKLSLDPGFRISLLAFMEQSPDVWLKSVQSVHQGLQKDGGVPNSEFIKYLRKAQHGDCKELRSTVATAICGLEQLSASSEEPTGLPIAEALQTLVATEPRSSSQGHSRSATTAEAYEVPLDRDQWIKFLKEYHVALVETIGLDDHLLHSLRSRGILDTLEFLELKSFDHEGQSSPRVWKLIEILQDGFISTDKLKVMIQVLESHHRLIAALLLKSFVEDLQRKQTSNLDKL